MNLGNVKDPLKVETYGWALALAVFLEEPVVPKTSFLNSILLPISTFIFSLLCKRTYRHKVTSYNNSVLGARPPFIFHNAASALPFGRPGQYQRPPHWQERKQFKYPRTV